MGFTGLKCSRLHFMRLFGLDPAQGMVRRGIVVGNSGYVSM